MGIFANFVKRTKERQHTTQMAVAADARGALVALEAAEREGVDVLDASLNDHYAELFEAAGVTIDAVPPNLERISVRRNAAAVVADGPRRKSEVARLDAECESLDRKIAEQHRKSLGRLEEMREALRIASDLANEVPAAMYVLLSTADISAEEATLNEKQASLRKEIDRLRAGLNPNAGPIDQNLHRMPQEFPAASVAETKRILANLNSQKIAPDAKKVAELRGRLKFGEGKVTEFKARLAELEKEWGAIQRKQESLHEQKLVPENFAIVKAKAKPTEPKGLIPTHLYAGLQN